MKKVSGQSYYAVLILESKLTERSVSSAFNSSADLLARCVELADSVRAVSNAPRESSSWLLAPCLRLSRSC